jgi:dTDP-4-dehydrorhamnose 3,5-epimerase
MIDGVIINPLKQISDERRRVMHMLREDFERFVEFGVICFSCVYAGAIKGRHIHKIMTLNYTVPHCSIKFVLYDE